MSKEKLTPWERMTGLLKLEKQDFLQILYYAIFTGVVSLSLPLGIQAIVNLIQGARVSTSWIVLVALVTGGVAFVGVLQLMQIRILENIQQKIFTRASFEFVYRFPKIKMSELRNFYPPELANRFFDILTVQKSLPKLVLDLPAAIVQILFGLILLSFYHPFFIFYGILLILLIYVVFKFTAKQGLESSLQESKYKYKIAHWIQEIARTLVSFKLSGKTTLALTKNDNLVEDYLDSRERHFQVLKKQFIFMVIFKVLVTAGLLVIGGLLVLNQQMNIGQFVAAEIIILLIITSVEKLISGLESFYDVLTSLEKMGQVVDKELESQGGEHPFSLDELLNIELKQVSWTGRRDQKYVLKDISFSIKPGDKIYLKGPNGAGKSTLLKIIAGILEPKSGDIYVNNISLKGININHYRSLLGQSLTEESPFEGTILENITFGDATISQKRVHWALEKCGLTEFVKEQPEGINTIVYPEGKEFSFTIAKKIVLARSIVRHPKMLILKDPLIQFSPDEKLRIIRFLSEEINPGSFIVASHDPIWEEHCNRVFKLENGTLTIEK